MRTIVFYEFCEGDGSETFGVKLTERGNLKRPPLYGALPGSSVGFNTRKGKRGTDCLCSYTYRSWSAHELKISQNKCLIRKALIIILRQDCATYFPPALSWKSVAPNSGNKSAAMLRWKCPESLEYLFKSQH